jgi:hypothetical protein
VAAIVFEIGLHAIPVMEENIVKLEVTLECYCRSRNKAFLTSPHNYLFASTLQLSVHLKSLSFGFKIFISATVELQLNCMYLSLILCTGVITLEVTNGITSHHF